jgi:hypothetical protein
MSGTRIGLIYLISLAVGVPWYWSADDTTMILGVPAWVAVAIGVSFVTSAFTAWLLRKPWPEELDTDG